MIRNRAPRRGFTLIELLMVISILALLAALTAAGIGRVRNAQMTRTSESTVQKLQQALKQNLTATLDEATGDKNPYLETVRTQCCEGDKDRAKALLAYAYTRREFPQTFAEATSPVVLVSPTGTPVLTFPPHKAFTSVAGKSASDEASVLLYLIVSEKGNRGMVFANDDALRGAETTDPSCGLKVYKDAWGIPITFVRWFQGNAELQQAPYANPKSGLNDPFDRMGFNNVAKLRDWPNKGFSQTALGVSFDGTNKVITAVSAGEDKNMTTPDDNIFGYRLVRFGNRGD